MTRGLHVGQLFGELRRAQEAVSRAEAALVDVVAKQKYFAERARALQEVIDRQGREIVEGLDEVECITAWVEARLAMGRALVP